MSQLPLASEPDVSARPGELHEAHLPSAVVRLMPEGALAEQAPRDGPLGVNPRGADDLRVGRSAAAVRPAGRAADVAGRLQADGHVVDALVWAAPAAAHPASTPSCARKALLPAAAIAPLAGSCCSHGACAAAPAMGVAKAEAVQVAAPPVRHRSAPEAAQRAHPHRQRQTPWRREHRRRRRPSTPQRPSRLDGSSGTRCQSNAGHAALAEHRAAPAGAQSMWPPEPAKSGVAVLGARHHSLSGRGALDSGQLFIV
mmetsp:Transcript_60835/g.190792  ORF Transcript_60835/g.190792 Transcript_60835/m.190792 type:complete len:256 (+) Transcript_60835:444-1211(+)